MSVGKRLGKERKRIGLNKTEFGKIGGVTKASQLNYETCKSSPHVGYWEAVCSAGADVHYILTGETKHDQLFAAIKASTEKMAGLTLSKQCKAAIVQLIISLHDENIEQIKAALESIGSGQVGLNGINKDKKCGVDALPNYSKGELTTAEKNLIHAYRKANQIDKSIMDRLAHLVEKAVEAESGIVEGVIDGE